MKDVLLLTVAEVTEQFQRRALSPVEVLNSTLERAEAVQASLNPFRLLDADGAREAAKASEKRWAEGQPLSPLDGVLVSIKDNQAVRGQTRTSGSLSNQHAAPMKEDAPHVARLREAGAVLFARTNMCDSAWKGVCDSPLSGITRNPWNRELTPGGSSGGAGVAVSTGCGAIATGSDGGGSIRIPAAFTGVYGIKPTTGRIPGITEAPDISSVGPLTRSVADAALALSVMCQPDSSDPLSSALTRPDFVKEAGRGAIGEGKKPLRVAVSFTSGFADAGSWPKLDPSRHDAVEAAARALAEAGAIVDYADPPTHHISEYYFTVCEVAFAAMIAPMSDDRKALLDPGLVETVKRGMMTSAVAAQQAQLERIRLTQAWIGFLSQYDLMLTPCVPIAPFRAGHNINTPDAKIYPQWYDWTPHTWVCNAAKLPAASCPWGLDPAGLPQAVQLVSRHFREDLILRASAVLEAAKPGVLPSPQLWKTA